MKEVMRVLLVEDDDAHAELISESFRSAENAAQLSVVTTVADAVDYLAHQTPDILITDLLLPDGEGTQLLPQSETERRFPILLLSSYGDAELAAQVRSEGAVYYVEKSPAIFERLPDVARRAVLEWLRRDPPQAASR